jgi:hypothetical protein
MSDESRSFSHLSYHVGGDWQVRCSTYAETTPILSVEGGPSTLSISTRGRTADESAVQFARALAREARRFADEMERKHAAQLADAEGTNKAAGSDAA